MEKERCSTTVYPQERYGSFKGHQCRKPVWKDGWCKVHHPETVAQRDKEATERWNKKWEDRPEMQLKKANDKIEELTGAIKALLFVFDRALEPGMIGYEVCEKARQTAGISREP